MALPDVSATYPCQIEELAVGRGDYVIGGAKSMPFLEKDHAKQRRPLIFGEVYDSLEGYPELAASMFSGRQTDIEEWSVMWKELGADGICLRLSDGCPADIVKKVSDRTRMPIMVQADTDTLIEASEAVDDSILILYPRSKEDCMSLCGRTGKHIIIARGMDCDPAELALAMKEKGAEKIIMDLGAGQLGPSLKDLNGRMEKYRIDGLNGVPGCGLNIICDVSGTWDDIDDDTTVREASMKEGMVSLSVMVYGADLLVAKGPGAADMGRVYGEELADL